MATPGEDSAGSSNPSRSCRSARRRLARSFNEQLSDKLDVLETNMNNHFLYLQSQMAMLAQLCPTYPLPGAPASETSSMQVEYKQHTIEIPRYNFVFRDVPMDGTVFAAPPGLQPVEVRTCSADEIASMGKGPQPCQERSANIYNILEDLASENDSPAPQPNCDQPEAELSPPRNPVQHAVEQATDLGNGQSELEMPVKCLHFDIGQDSDEDTMQPASAEEPREQLEQRSRYEKPKDVPEDEVARTNKKKRRSKKKQGKKEDDEDAVGQVASSTPDEDTKGGRYAMKDIAQLVMQIQQGQEELMADLRTCREDMESMRHRPP